MKKILVATDGSEYSKKALLKAKQMATDLGSEVTALSVITRDYMSYESVQAINAEEARQKAKIEGVENVLKEAEEIFSDFKGEFSTVYKTGDVVDEIIKFAEEGDYDLLIMGSRGLGVFSRTLLGSVSDKVIHHVNVSVMIVK